MISSSFSFTAMEEWNMLAADCVVISCCCQCLLLQILVFLMLKLPWKLIRKTREYAKKKLRQRKGNDDKMKIESACYEDVLVRIHEQSFRIQGEMTVRDGEGFGCGGCMDEVEKMMEELYQKGEFGFGSFWGREEPCGFAVPTKIHNDPNLVRYQVVDLLIKTNVHA
ncbi:uncharacterized protein LOC124829559 [Vigna umbellata]|uniref:uncharacterized protein LOC124829551 n=1 Tax=Vigna umbellata TaxID=87088 RepID=UPI001F5E4463|nr:uncharacterized protein LOC124829551 [Vigna umbellata]XP_047159055.1 uncharacterized protein LOC124829559 [Vigna umbellata]